MGNRLDLLIIGSGPAGLSAAIYANRAKLKTLLIEREYEGTGQIANSERVDNYLGLAGISGFELGERFLSHARGLGLKLLDGDAVSLSKSEDSIWHVTLKDGDVIDTASVIFAGGASPRMLGVSGEDTFLGRGISTCALCDGAFYKDKNVAVIGGGDTALEDALYLSKICRTVYLIHRRDDFRGAARTKEQVLAEENIHLRMNANVSKFLGEQRLEGLVLDSGENLSIDGAFLAIGQIPKTDILEGFVRFDTSGHVLAGEDGRTDADGLFVAGDVRAKRLRQVITAASDGANAAFSAYEYLSERGFLEDRHEI